MLQCAQWLLENETEQLARLLAERPDWRLKVVGHSLGAGTASLFSIMARSDEEVKFDVCSAGTPSCPSF